MTYYTFKSAHPGLWSEIGHFFAFKADSRPQQHNGVRTMHYFQEVMSQRLQNRHVLEEYPSRNSFPTWIHQHQR